MDVRSDILVNIPSFLEELDNQLGSINTHSTRSLLAAMDAQAQPTMSDFRFQPHSSAQVQPHSSAQVQHNVQPVYGSAPPAPAPDSHSQAVNYGAVSLAAFTINEDHLPPEVHMSEAADQEDAAQVSPSVQLPGQDLC